MTSSILLLRAGRTSLRRPMLQRQVLKPRQNTTNSKPVKGQKGASEQVTNAEKDTIPVANTVGPIPMWQRLGPLSTAFSAYGRSQAKRPLTTQLCSSLAIYFLGDMSAQRMGGEPYDPFRTMRMLVTGGVASIPSYKW
jgi:protein Mpv17